MSQNKAEIPDTRGHFQIVATGEMTKRQYVGEFFPKILNQKERAFVAKHLAFLNGEHAAFLDLATQNLHLMISYLRFALTAPYPPFWLTSDLGYELYDSNVIREVYNKTLEFEENWFKEVWGEEALKQLQGKTDGPPETPPAT